MIEKGDVVVTGVSGGADSVCLLFMLHKMQQRLGFQVVACHVNHGLRGKDADADETYVKELCSTLHVPLEVFHENVELISRNRKQSTEEAGREVRAEDFEKVCMQYKGSKIAAAHHQDDNAETLLLNVARGTGLRGLCGIRPVRGKWIRPLLCLNREEIESWLREKGIEWCSDVTNEEDDYTRNRVRHHILPAMEQQINQKTVMHLNELSRQAREIWEYLDEKTEAAWKRCVKEKNSDFVLSKAEYDRLPAAVQTLLLRRCICEAAETERDIGTIHVEMVRALFEKQTGRMANVPGGVSVHRVYEGLCFRKQRADGAGLGKQETWDPVWLSVPGETYLPATNQTVVCTLHEAEERIHGKEIPQKSYTKCFDYDIIKYGLCARTRRSGDYLTTGEKNGRQKLKSYFVNEKVPREERADRLLIADGSHIVWIPGMRMSSEYRLRDGTKKILMIKITEGKNDGREDQSIAF